MVFERFRRATQVFDGHRSAEPKTANRRCLRSRADIETHNARVGVQPAEGGVVPLVHVDPPVTRGVAHAGTSSTCADSVRLIPRIFASCSRVLAGGRSPDSYRLMSE